MKTYLLFLFKFLKSSCSWCFMYGCCFLLVIMIFPQLIEFLFIGDNLIESFVSGIVIIEKKNLLICKKLDFNKVVTRNMFSRAVKKGGEVAAKNSEKLGTSLNKQVPYKQSEKPYATFNVRDHDENSPDPQAALNNPKVGKNQQTHPEIQRGVCDIPDCKEKNCGFGSTCEPIQENQGVAHGTHGNPKTSQGDVVPLDKNTDMKGASKPQNMVVYDFPHDSSVTSESFCEPGQSTGKGTDYLHDPQHPNRIASIIKETKDK